MKQNIKTVGEVELDQEELKEVAFLYIKEDRKLIFHAVQKYLKSLHQFELKKVATGDDGNGGMMAKCEIESIKAEASRPLFIKPIDRSDRKEQTGGHKKPNQGFYTVLMTILQEGRKKSKEPMDAKKVYDEILFELPNLTWRNFTIYVSDKRRQAASGYHYDGKKKLIHAKRG